MANFSDLLLCHPDYVSRKLKNDGYRVKYLQTEPPGPSGNKGQKRTLKINFIHDRRAEIIWSYEYSS